jgi:hypothetical protein
LKNGRRKRQALRKTLAESGKKNSVFPADAQEPHRNTHRKLTVTSLLPDRVQLRGRQNAADPKKINDAALYLSARTINSLLSTSTSCPLQGKSTIVAGGREE